MLLARYFFDSIVRFDTENLWLPIQSCLKLETLASDVRKKWSLGLIFGEKERPWRST